MMFKKYNLKRGSYYAVEHQNEFVEDLHIIFLETLFKNNVEKDFSTLDKDDFNQSVKEVSAYFSDLSMGMNYGKFLPQSLFQHWYNEYASKVKDIVFGR